MMHTVWGDDCVIFDNFQLFELFEVIVRKYKGNLDDYIRLLGPEGHRSKFTVHPTFLIHCQTP